MAIMSSRNVYFIIKLKTILFLSKITAKFVSSVFEKYVLKVRKCSHYVYAKENIFQDLFFCCSCAVCTKNTRV